MRIALRILVLGITMAVMACHQDTAPKSEETQVQWDIPPRYKSDGVQAGMAAARETLPRFLDIHANAGPDLQEFRVLVKKPASQPEYVDNFVWVEDFAPVETGFVGDIQKHPEDISTDARTGRHIAFTQDEIYDWTFIGPNGIYGSFVTRAELDKSEVNVDNLKARFRDLSELPQP